jgi:hypothetical protein
LGFGGSASNYRGAVVVVEVVVGVRGVVGYNAKRMVVMSRRDVNFFSSGGVPF